MNIDYPVPFFANTSDGTHCSQAALKMILKYFWPDKEFSWEELEKVTAKSEGMWTWPMAGLIWMQANGFEVINIEVFDYSKFIEKGKDYLREEYGEQVASEQDLHSDIEKERKIAEQFIQQVKTIFEIPTQEQIKEFLRDGYLIKCTINSRVINNREGYAGHSVVVKGFDEAGFIIHDPGLPGLENRKVAYDIFEKAWAYPNEKAKNIMAFKLRH